MNKKFWIIISWIRKGEMMLHKSIAEVDRDTTLGQNYKYWKEEDIAELYSELFDYDEDIYILEVEEINDFRHTAA